MEHAPDEKRGDPELLPWTPLESNPVDPEFYRRTLHYMPTALVVVDKTGEIAYGNEAFLDLMGLDGQPDATKLASYLHPDERSHRIEGFVNAVTIPSCRVLGGQTWGEVSCRMVTKDGSVIPVVFRGTGGLMDDAVGGVIYEVRLATQESLLGQILEGLSQGATMLHLLSLICEIIASPPLQIDAAILQRTPQGEMVIAASSTPLLTKTLQSTDADLPWRAQTPIQTPVQVSFESLPETVRSPLVSLTYAEAWVVSVESPLTANTLRIIAFSQATPLSDHTIPSRLRQARELASAVLLRTQSDVLLDFAAEHDVLTGLPNRAAFHQQAEALNPGTNRAAIHLDLDGLQAVNDEHGTDTGDAVLRAIADRLQSACKTAEIIGRVGDDEFTMVTIADQEPGQAEASPVSLARRVHRAIREPIFVADRPIVVTASVGVAIVDHGISTDQMLTWAEAAMRDAKKRGGARICRHYVLAN